MAGERRISQRGLDLIKAYEGLRMRAVALESGGYVVGYGHTKAARAGLQLSQPDAELLLRGHDLPPVEQAVLQSVFAPLNQNEFDALVCFAFNIGLDAFKTSQVLADMNAGKTLQAAAGMLAWRKARVNGQLMIVDALIRRRTAEVALMLEVPGGAPIAPSALITPQLDISAAILSSNEGAVAVETRIEAATAKSVILDDDPAVRPDLPPEARAAGMEEKGAVVARRLTRILGTPAAATSEAPSGEKVGQPAAAAPVRDAFKPASARAPEVAVTQPADLVLPEPLPESDVDIDDLEVYDFGSYDPFAEAEKPPQLWQPMAFLLLLGIVLLGSGLVKMVAGIDDDGGFLQGVLVLSGIALSLIGGYYLMTLFRPSSVQPRDHHLSV